ncbi:MAG TPA: steryl acetyl hydrolase, partial [Pseudomonas pachastrellae]|nr:steryl acetyl hydrolase [Halopseudomonas pachastrellae]
MSRYVDELYLNPGQPGLRTLLRGMLKLLFRGLIRPPVPFAVQALVLRLLTLGMPLASGVTRSVEQIAGRPCMWHRPAAGGNGRVLLYLHGGAFVIGSPQTHRGICSTLANRGQFDVCALDYRLAPAYPAPAACDDAVAAYQALLQRGYTPEQITLIGDSAGGNLVLVTAQKLAALKLPLPATLVCFSPVTDMTAEQLHAPAAGDPLLHPSWLDSA